MNNFIIGFLMILSSVCFQSEASSNGQDLDSHNQKQLESLLDQLVKDDEIPGASFATFNSHRTTWSYATGYLSEKKQKKVSAEKTLFPVASLSKMLIGMSAGISEAEGKIQYSSSIDNFKQSTFYQTLNRHCPERLVELRDVNVMHLLTHTSGLVQDLPGVSLWWEASALEDGALPTWQDFKKNFCDAQFVYDPGQIPGQSKYSNLGMTLVAQIVAGFEWDNDFERYSHERILEPLEMDSTAFSLNSTEDLVWSHGVRGSAYGGDVEDRTVFPKVFDPGFYKSISLNSTSVDLAKLGSEILNWATKRRRPAISLDWKSLLEPEAMAFLNPKQSLAKGFFLRDTVNSDYTFHHKGFVCYGHTGTGWGSRAIIYACPELNWGFVGLFNARDVNREKFLWEVSQKLSDLGLLKRSYVSRETRKWLQQVRNFQARQSVPEIKRPEVIDRDLAPVELADFIGSYHSDTDGEQKVQLSSQFKLVFLGGELEQDRWDPNRFWFPLSSYFGHSGESIEFVRNRNGEVTKIIAFGMLHGEKL